jgi:ATP-binding cassette, subfamily B, bacterial CvaB/MchF/RaxB
MSGYSVGLGTGQRLPVVLQMEAAECGLACLAMVSVFHGHRFSLSELRRRFPVSRKGTTLKALVTMAQQLKLDARGVSLDLDHLDQLRLPCVLHWDMNHFVVLKSVSRHRIVVHDPAVGERSMDREDFSKHFTGVALELSPAVDFAPEERKEKLRLGDLLGRVVGLKRGVAQVVALALALEVVSVVMPFQVQWVIDHALLSADRELITVLGLGFLLLVVLRAAISALRSWLVVTLSTHLNFQWLGNVFAHLMRLPLEYFEKRHLGAIMQNFGSVTHIQETLTNGFVQALVDGLMVVGTVVVMFIYSPQLTLLALAAVAVYALVHALVFPAQRNAAAEELTCESKQNTHFMESARGVQSVRLFGRVAERRMGWLNMLADQFNASLRGQRITILHQTVNTLLFGLLRVGMIWLAALAVMRREFTVGMLFAFLSYADQLVARSGGLVDRWFEFRMLKLHMERVADIVGSPVEEAGAQDEVELQRVDNALEVRGVSYRYSSAEADVLDKVSFEIAAGEFVAITGPSGCGKTTLVKVLLGLLQPADGEVLLGGVSLKRVGLDNYRRIIGTVMQEDTLFTGSIADNICFFDPTPDMERIVEVAKLAAIHDEIEQMPMAYGTLVGDIGSGLSGGQKQRVLLARALYRQPRILVLDEATSHLDVDNERSVNAAVRELKLTRIVVAHRPETIRAADRVIMMERGRVVAHAAADAANASPATAADAA